MEDTLCIYCNNKTIKDGKSNNKQRFKCLICSKIFNEDKLKVESDRKDRHELLKKLYIEDKLSTVKIGEKLGISNVAVGRIIRKYGLTRTHKEARELFTIETKLPVGKIIELYTLSGFSSTIIAERLNCSKRSVLNVLKKNEIEMTNVYTHEHPRKDDIIALYLSGCSMLTVSKQIGVSYTTVNSLMKKYNLTRTDDRFGLGVNYNEWLKTIPVYRRYKSDVWKITRKQNVDTLSNYSLRGVAGVCGAYHLDHKYSILEGFKNDVHPDLIGNIGNLEFIPWKENIIKKDKCSITLEELIRSKR